MQDAWHTISTTALSEFSDITDLAQATRIVIRLTLAALLGGLLGWERESAGQAAGVRTHMLVCMGSAMFVMIAVQTGAQANEASRVMQGVIAGVGFLGAGAILKESTHHHGTAQVKGLTTAAGIWLTAAMGVAAGLGKEVTAILSALLAFGILHLVPLLLSRTGRSSASESSASESPSGHPEK